MFYLQPISKARGIFQCKRLDQFQSAEPTNFQAFSLKTLISNPTGSANAETFLLESDFSWSSMTEIRGETTRILGF